MFKRRTCHIVGHHVSNARENRNRTVYSAHLFFKWYALYKFSFYLLTYLLTNKNHTLSQVSSRLAIINGLWVTDEPDIAVQKVYCPMPIILCSKCQPFSRTQNRYTQQDDTVKYLSHPIRMSPSLPRPTGLFPSPSDLHLIIKLFWLCLLSIVSVNSLEKKWRNKEVKHWCVLEDKYYK